MYTAREIHGVYIVSLIFYMSETIALAPSLGTHIIA